MAVPDFQTLMRPLLEELESGQERPISDVRAALATRFSLTEEDLAERLPSGSAKTFNNRVGWAATYLHRCGLLDRPRRSVYRITERGRQVLAAHPDRVDLGVLAQFPEFDEFRSTSGRRAREHGASAQLELATTPEERIEAAYQELRDALIADLRERIAAMPWAAFEELVLDVLEAMGYGDEGEGARLRTGKGGHDSGIDGVIREDRLGLDVVYVQAKRWGAGVGRPAVQGFVGALQGARASKGIIFAASSFSPDAREYAANVSPRVVLVDGGRLAELMVDHNVGVSAREVYAVKRVDNDYFGDDS
jgi:restriction system protein